MQLRSFTKISRRTNIRFCSTQDRAKILPSYIPTLEEKFITSLKESGDTNFSVKTKPNSFEIIYHVNPEIKEQVEVANELPSELVEKIDFVIIVAGFLAGFILFLLAFGYILFHMFEFADNHSRELLAILVALVIAAITRLP